MIAVRERLLARDVETARGRLESMVLNLTGYPGGGSRLQDRSFYGNHGTIIGATWAKLPSGLWVLSFDGTDDYVQVPHSSSLNIDSAITLEVWTKVLSPTMNVNTYPIAKSSAYQIRHGFGLACYLFDLYIDGAYRSTPDYMPYDNEFHFIAGTYSEADRTLRLYVDGILRSSTVLSGLTTYKINTNTNNVIIESGYNQGRIAIIDKVRLYNRALSALDVLNAFEQVKHLFGL